MTERLIAKLDRLGAEAGIKEMTPEIYQFAQLLNDEKMKQWDEWKANREWVGLTPEEVKEISLANRPYVVDMVVALEARLKQKNGYDK
jgi:hypothetical protein